MNILNIIAAGALAGLINGAAGTGGGTVAVSTFSTSMPQRNAQATAVMLICVLSAVSMCFRGISEGIIHVLVSVCGGGMIGAVIGAKLLVDTGVKTLKILFAAATVIAGIRLVL